ncbi:MAG: TonB-dependent receptor domain-containing protein [Bryobacteraceae bacterium]
MAALGQRDLGTILGVVTDNSGAVIPGARVTLINDETGVRTSLETNDAGYYLRPAMQPGQYSVEVEATGFKKAIQRSVRISAGDRVQVNLSLEVGEITQSIEVSSAPPALQTESTIIGATLQARQTSELPLGGQRKFAFLARLSPGVVPGEPGARDAAGGAFSANGVRSNGQNNFLLNGVDNNVNVIDFINQTAYVIGPSVEAIGEMKIITNGYNAEYGRGAGGVLNVTIKSGTNEIHGAVFEFLQNDKLNSNSWENNKAGKDRGAFRQNQFGAAIGGPIRKDRTFFFVDYQGTRIRSTGGAVPGLGNTFTRTIPWPEMKNGNFSRLLQAGIQIYDFESTAPRAGGGFTRTPFPGNIIPSSRFDPVAKRIIDMFPDPNQNLHLAIPSNNYLVVTQGRQQNDQGDVRIDHRLTDKDSLFGSLSWSEEDKFNQPPLPGALDSTGFAGQVEGTKGRNAMLSWARVWSPSIITETRAAFTRLVTHRVGANADQDSFREFGIGGFNPFTATSNNGGLPLLSPDGYSGIGGSNWLPTLEYSNVWNFVENVSINKSSHAIKFGVEYRPIQFPFFQVPSSRGQFSFGRNRTQDPQAPAVTGDGMASFLTGHPSSGQITTTNFVSSERKSFSWYIQDDWKIRPNLTLNIGLRYDLFSPISERFGRQSTFDYHRAQPTLVIPKGKDQDAPLPINFAVAVPNVAVERGVASKYLVPWDTTNFAPRIGISWQPISRTVVRAGYGMFYGGEENQGGDPNRGINVPFNQQTQFNAPNAFARVDNLNRLVDGFPLDPFNLPAPIRFRTVAPNFRSSLVHKWNFALQRELPGGMVWEGSYIGSAGARLLTNWNPNQPLNHPEPGQPLLPRLQWGHYTGNTSMTESVTFGFSHYHGFATKLEKRMSNGLDFLASYTWSHALTNLGTPLTGGPGVRDVRNLSAEYAHAPFDIRHRFVYSTVYDLPFGRGRKFGSNWNRATNLLIGNWQVNGILTLQTGPPRNIGTREAVCSCGGATRPDLVPGKNPNDAPPGGRSPDRWFDHTAVQAPARGTFGNLGHFAVFGPGIRNLDLSLFKDFRINERYRVQFRTEWFNFSNTPQFNPEQMDLTQGDPALGRINGTRPGTQRNVQFALRFMF